MLTLPLILTTSVSFDLVTDDLSLRDLDPLLVCLDLLRFLLLRDFDPLEPPLPLEVLYSVL